VDSLARIEAALALSAFKQRLHGNIFTASLLNFEVTFTLSIAPALRLIKSGKSPNDLIGF